MDLTRTILPTPIATMTATALSTCKSTSPGLILRIPAPTSRTSRSVSLIAGTPTPAALSVSPADAFSPVGSKGGPFVPSSKTYALINTGSYSMDWIASKSLIWLTLSASSGTLAPAATNTITVSVNATANSLPPGTYAGSVLFSNVTNG